MTASDFLGKQRCSFQSLIFTFKAFILVSYVRLVEPLPSVERRIDGLEPVHGDGRQAPDLGQG